MFLRKCKSLCSILDQSPMFVELSIRERERLVRDLLKKYPQLLRSTYQDEAIGYEAGWLADESRHV